MLYPWKRPGRSEDENIHLLFDRERSINLGKSKIVADAQSKPESAKRKTPQLVAGRKALVLPDRSRGEKVSLAITPNNVAIRIDENLRIIDRRAIAL